MKTKNGLDLVILGQIAIENKPFFIVKMPHAFYQSDILISHVVLPAYEFSEYDNGIQPAEVVL